MQDKYTSFLGHYNKACDLHVPKIDISGEIKPRVKWLTRGMKNNMRKRLNLWHSNQRSKWKNQSLKKEYELTLDPLDLFSSRFFLYLLSEEISGESVFSFLPLKENFFA